MSCLLEQKEQKINIVFYSWTLIRFNKNIAQNETEFGLDFKPALQFSSLIALSKCFYTICTLEN